MGRREAGGRSKSDARSKKTASKHAKTDPDRPQWMDDEEVPQGFQEFNPQDIEAMIKASASTTRSAPRLPGQNMPWKPLETEGVEVAPTATDGGLVWLEELDGTFYDKMVYRGGDASDVPEQKESKPQKESKAGQKRKREAADPAEEERLDRKKAKKEKEKEKQAKRDTKSKGKADDRKKSSAKATSLGESQEDVHMEEEEYDIEETDNWTDINVDGVEIDDDYGDSDEDLPTPVTPAKTEKKAKTKAKQTKQKVTREKKPANDVILKEESASEEEQTAELAGPQILAEPWRESCAVVDDRILRAIEGVMKFKSATECQKQAVERAVGGARHDVLLAAPTGSGKTLAFGIPVIHMLCEMKDKIAAGRMDKPTGPSALILAPTRELALQITSHLLDAAHFAPIQVVPVIGGIAVQKQERLFRSKPEIIVATPGRLWQLISLGYQWVKDIASVRFLVLDEADRMMSMGHYPELHSILSLLPQWRHKADKIQPREMPKVDTSVADAAEQWQQMTTTRTICIKRQTFVCSATLSNFLKEQLRHKSTAHLKKAQKKSKGKMGGKVEDKKHTLEDLISLIDFHRKIDVVDVSTKQLTPDTLKESRIHCLDNEKDFYLYYLLQRYKGKTIVFVNSIDCLRRIVSIFALLRCPVYPMHAQMQQRQRLKNLERFRTQEHCALVSSDVTARGIDIPAVDHVLHYQLPRTVELYVHRSGRTARATSSGISVLLVGPSDRQAFTRICKVLGKDSSDVPDFPIVGGAMREVRKRVKAARALEKETHMKRKQRSDRNWYLRAAEEMDIDLDDDLLSDDDEAEKHRRNKKHEQLIGTLKQRLDDLLAKPLLTGMSSARYITPEQVREMDLLASSSHGFSATDDLRARNKIKNRK